MTTVIDIPKKHNWTYADYALLPPEFRCEIINGKLVLPRMIDIKSNPSHQSVKSNLEKAIAPYQPRILIITEKNKHLFLGNTSVKDAPKGIIQIISPGNNIDIRVKKKAFYEKFGVEEYWIVDTQNQSIEVYTLEQGVYELYSSAELKGPAKSKVIEGFTVEAEDIFKEDF